MIQKLASLLRRAVRDLIAPASTTPPPAAPAEAPALTEVPVQTVHPAASDNPAEPPASSLQPPAPSPQPRIWRRIISAEQARLAWLRGHPWVIGITIGLIIAIVVGETWLITAGQWFAYYVNLYRPDLTSHPVALIGGGIILFYLLFGLHWLYNIDDFARWVLGGIKGRPRLSAFVGSILLLIGLWLANNHDTWVVLPFTVGQVETGSLDGEKVAIQLVAELSQVGVGNPTPVLILWELREPHTSSGSVMSRRNLPLEECDAVLRGPGDFLSSRRVPLPRVLTGSQGSRLDLGNLSIGTINIPSQIFTQFLLKVLPTGYREFNGQITENNGELEISVSSHNPPNAWRVAGPSDIFPEIMEYLALRMALDLNPEVIKSSGLNASPSDQELAFAMGNDAYRQQRYQRARAFFELADRFKPLDEKIDAMLGLTYYQMALAQPGDDQTRFNTALHAMEAAVREDPNGDSSLLRPYLICLYHKAGQAEGAKAQRTIFTQYLLRLEFQDFDVRVEALKQLPLRGPGQHLSVVGGDVILVNDGGDIVGVAGQPLSAGLLLPHEKPNQGPRQIGVYGDSNLLFISQDGAVLAYPYRTTDEVPTLKTLIEGRTLSGIQQIGTSTSHFGRNNLFLLNRFGQTYWCEPDAEAGSASACPPRQTLVADPTNVRQIFPVEDRLYVLATDGAVWYTEVNINGQAFTPRQLTPPAQVQEIFSASDGAVYLLHDNGNVWRYYDDGRPATDDVKLIDSGTGTAQIFEAGGFLYLLKGDGAVWRISNLHNPASTDIVKITTPVEGTSIQEMFVTAESPSGEEASRSRTVYLLTDKRTLLMGTDTGSAQMTLASLDTTPTQVASTP